MRLNNEKIAPALQMCEQLGSGAAADCSQGIYHDYWFAVNGIDATAKPKDVVTDPRELCGAQPDAVRARRAGTARSWRPPRARAWSPASRSTRPARGLEGLQRQACVTGASVIGPPDPRQPARRLLRRCEADTDVVACIRGTKVQNLLNVPGRDVGRADQGTATRFSGSLALDVRPLARQDARRRQRRQVPHHRVPQAPHGRGAQGVRRGREEHGGPARDLLVARKGEKQPAHRPTSGMSSTPLQKRPTLLHQHVSGRLYRAIAD